MTDWREGLTEKDWLLDGNPIRSHGARELYLELDWSKAWVDAGPSPAGNSGPYWHVPRSNSDTIHRLYPRVLLGKWGALINQAVVEHTALSKSRSQPILEGGEK